MASSSEDERAKMFRIAGAGMEFFGTVLVCILGGYFLDRWLKTSPVLVLIGVGLGFAIGLFQLIRLSKEMERENKKTKKP